MESFFCSAFVLKYVFVCCGCFLFVCLFLRVTITLSSARYNLSVEKLLVSDQLFQLSNKIISVKISLQLISVILFFYCRQSQIYYQLSQGRFSFQDFVSLSCFIKFCLLWNWGFVCLFFFCILTGPKKRMNITISISNARSLAKLLMPKTAFKRYLHVEVNTMFVFICVFRDIIMTF